MKLVRNFVIFFRIIQPDSCFLPQREEGDADVERKATTDGAVGFAGFEEGASGVNAGEVEGGADDVRGVTTKGVENGAPLGVKATGFIRLLLFHPVVLFNPTHSLILEIPCWRIPSFADDHIIFDNHRTAEIALARGVSGGGGSEGEEGFVGHSPCSLSQPLACK